MLDTAKRRLQRDKKPLVFETANKNQMQKDLPFFFFSFTWANNEKN